MENRDEKIWKDDIKTLRILKFFVLFLITCITIFVLSKNNIIGYAIIPTQSMEPTIKAKSVVLQKGYTENSIIKRGTVCYFKRDGLEGMENSSNSYLAKRVIGLPGETISIKDGYVYINGELYDESSYIEMGITNSSEKEWILGEDEYFMLGDNRKNSKDSRFFGPVKRSNILGEIIFKLYPFSDIGGL